MQTYKYLDIDPSQPHFRLVKLFKGESEDPIRCWLFHSPINEIRAGITFEALSYTWGSDKKTQEISLNECCMPVTENLHEALHYLRSTTLDRILWIDAICIDQGNSKERLHQVTYMGDIYKAADSVIIWLGPAADNSDSLFRCLQQVCEGVTDSSDDLRQTLRFRIEHDPEIWQQKEKQTEVKGTTLSRTYSKDEAKMTLTSILQRSWFYRIWILQEIANARDAVVHCGSESISSKVFSILPAILGVHTDEHIRAVLDLMPGPDREILWRNQQRDLRTVLIKFSRCQATDLRDMVYALLALSSDTNDTRCVKADYTKPLEGVLKDTTSFLLRDWAKSDIANYTIPNWDWNQFSILVPSLDSMVLHIALFNGDKTIAHDLIHYPDIDHSSFLSSAVELGHEELVQELLTLPDINEGIQESLYIAAGRQSENILGMLLDHCTADSVPVNIEKILANAIGSDIVANVKLCVSHTANPSTKLEWGNGVIDHDFERMRQSIPLDFLDELVDDNPIPRDKYLSMYPTPAQHCAENALITASERGNLDVIKELLYLPLIGPISAQCGSQLLRLAASAGDKAVMELLLMRTAIKSHDEGEDDLTPLDWALRETHMEVVMLLLTSKIFPLCYLPTLRDLILQGKIPLGSEINQILKGPIETPDSIINSSLFTVGFEPPRLANTMTALQPRESEGTGTRYIYGGALRAACRCGDIEVLELLLQDHEHRTIFDQIPTQPAIPKWYLNTFQKLIVAGLIELQESGNTEGRYSQVLHAACEKHDLVLLRTFIKHENYRGALDQLFASENLSEGCSKTLDALVDTGEYTINTTRGNYSGVLRGAFERQNIRLINYLLREGVTADIEGEACCRLLVSYRAPRKPLIQELLPIDASKSSGAQILNYGLLASIIYGFDDVALLLLRQKEVDVSFKGSNQRRGSMLLEAVHYGRFKVVESLLERGANVNAYEGRYGSALQVASSGGSVELVELLVQSGANVNLQGGKYGSPLHAASYKGNRQIIQILLQNGAHINLRSERYGTPLATALVQGHTEIARILEEHGARREHHGDTVKC